ncbi:unnamed protein product [Peniophora sp. CBMAI 1063]|nr:unnamed protein product [Peniophora sp. CBMAI 1063]
MQASTQPLAGETGREERSPPPPPITGKRSRSSPPATFTILKPDCQAHDPTVTFDAMRRFPKGNGKYLKASHTWSWAPDSVLKTSKFRGRPRTVTRLDSMAVDDNITTNGADSSELKPSLFDGVFEHYTQPLGIPSDKCEFLARGFWINYVDSTNSGTGDMAAAYAALQTSYLELPGANVADMGYLERLWYAKYHASLLDAIS